MVARAKGKPCHILDCHLPTWCPREQQLETQSPWLPSSTQTSHLPPWEPQQSPGSPRPYEASSIQSSFSRMASMWGLVMTTSSSSNSDGSDWVSMAPIRSTMGLQGKTLLGDNCQVTAAALVHSRACAPSRRDKVGQLQQRPFVQDPSPAEGWADGKPGSQGGKPRAQEQRNGAMDQTGHRHWRGQTDRGLAALAHARFCHINHA